MAIWGIGAFYRGGKNTDVSEDFKRNEGVFIGWSESDAPSVRRMFSSVKAGDLVYIKSYVIKGKRIRVKAIGVVTDTVVLHDPELGVGRKVKWLCKDQFDIPLSEEDSKNNVYNNTLYEEFSPSIAAEIIKKI